MDGTLINTMEVYLLEDDEIYSEFIRKALTQNDYKVKPFYTAEDCLVEVENKMPEVIIIDYKLPGMNGIEFFQRIQPMVNEDETKLILLSSLDDGNLVLDFIQKGIRDYVVKDEQVVSSLIGIIEGEEDDYYLFDD